MIPTDSEVVSFLLRSKVTPQNPKIIEERGETKQILWGEWEKRRKDKKAKK